MTSLWYNFSNNVFANRNWNCLLISAFKVHWRLQSTAARCSNSFSKTQGALRAVHVLLNNAFMKIIHKWLKKINNGHLITLQIWIYQNLPWRHYVWEVMHEAILKPSSKAQNSFWIKSCSGEDRWSFSIGPVNKAVLSFRNNSTEYVKGNGWAILNGVDPQNWNHCVEVVLDFIVKWF